jgi:hypothetical protein
MVPPPVEVTTKWDDKSDDKWDDKWDEMNRCRSPRGSWTNITVFAAALAVSGCEHGWDLDVTIEIPAELQQGFSATAQGRLYFDDLRAVFCEPSKGPTVVHFHKAGFGCGDQRTVVARLIPPRGEGQLLSCGVGRTDWPTTVEQKDLATAAATVVIFGPDTRCGTQTVRLVLTPIAPGTSDF